MMRVFRKATQPVGIIIGSKQPRIQLQNPSNNPPPLSNLKIGLDVFPERSLHPATKGKWTRDTAPSHQIPQRPQMRGPASTAPRA